MLDKEICIRCINKTHFWNEWYDQRWNRGKINCPYDKNFGISNTDVIPDNCKYKLEHVVNEAE